jgi:septal ring-binding cell division protein DamX
MSRTLEQSIHLRKISRTTTMEEVPLAEVVLELIFMVSGKRSSAASEAWVAEIGMMMRYDVLPWLDSYMTHSLVFQRFSTLP